MWGVWHEAQLMLVTIGMENMIHAASSSRIHSNSSSHVLVCSSHVTDADTNKQSNPVRCFDNLFSDLSDNTAANHYNQAIQITHSFVSQPTVLDHWITTANKFSVLVNKISLTICKQHTIYQFC